RVLGGGPGLLRRGGFLLLAEDGVIPLGEMLGLGQADAHDAHEWSLPRKRTVSSPARARPVSPGLEGYSNDAETKSTQGEATRRRPPGSPARPTSGRPGNKRAAGIT